MSFSWLRATGSRLAKADAVRKHLRDMLLASELKEVAKRRKASLNVDSADAGEMLRELTRTLPMNEAMARILRQTFDIPDDRSGGHKDHRKDNERPRREPRDLPPFNPQRFPSTFRARGGDAQENGVKLYKLPAGGSRSISFSTDVENDYFDRTDDPGDLQLAILRPAGKGSENGGGGSEAVEVDSVLNISRSSPIDGAIKITVLPNKDLKVGDTIEVRAELSSPDGGLVEHVLVRVTDPQQLPPRKAPEVEPALGIPELVLCSRLGSETSKSWEDIAQAGIEMDHKTVVYPLVEDDKLSRIYVNVDSAVLLETKSATRSSEASELASWRGCPCRLTDARQR